MTRLKLLLLGILRKMGQSRRSKHQNTARNEHYTMAKSRRFCRGLRCILRVKKWRRSENFDGVGILRICGVTSRSHIRLPTSTFTRCAHPAQGGLSHPEHPQPFADVSKSGAGNDLWKVRYFRVIYSFLIYGKLWK